MKIENEKIDEETSAVRFLIGALSGYSVERRKKKNVRTYLWRRLAATRRARCRGTSHAPTHTSLTRTGPKRSGQLSNGCRKALDVPQRRTNSPTAGTRQICNASATAHVTIARSLQGRLLTANMESFR